MEILATVQSRIFSSRLLSKNVKIKIHRTVILPLNGVAEWLYHSCFIFGRSRVQILAWRPANLTEVFRGFTQSLQVNAGITL
jgi:hypothetical protein